jgi:hypothetical protein
VKQLEIRWPSGKIQTIKEIEADRYLTIKKRRNEQGKQKSGRLHVMQTPASVGYDIRLARR